MPEYGNVIYLFDDAARSSELDPVIKDLLLTNLAASDQGIDDGEGMRFMEQAQTTCIVCGPLLDFVDDDDISHVRRGWAWYVNTGRRVPSEIDVSDEAAEYVEAYKQRIRKSRDGE